MVPVYTVMLTDSTIKFKRNILIQGMEQSWYTEFQLLNLQNAMNIGFTDTSLIESIALQTSSEIVSRPLMLSQHFHYQLK